MKAQAQRKLWREARQQYVLRHRRLERAIIVNRQLFDGPSIVDIINEAWQQAPKSDEPPKH